MIKTRRIEIIPDGDKKRITETIKTYSETSCQVANEIVRKTIFNLERYDEFKLKNIGLSESDLRKKFREDFGYSVQGFSYDATKPFSEKLPSYVRATLSSVIYKTLNSNKRDIDSFKVSIPSYRKEGIDFTHKS